MNKALAFALIAAAVAVNGCAGSAKNKAAREANPAPCPNVLVLNEASRMIEFAGDEAIENVAFSAEIVNVSLQCRYYLDKPIDAELEVDLAFGIGPAASENVKEFKYFVAVTRKDSEVIAKQEFVVPVEFGKNRQVKIVNEKIKEILIPRATETTAGTNFEIVVGMVVTPKQAVFNRSGKSLKFPEL